MSFPVVASTTETSFSGNTTAHAANLPATVNSGDLLLAWFSNDGDATVTTPSGWNLKYSTANGTSARLSHYYRIADGSEGGGTVDFVTSANESGAAQIKRITGWHGTTPPEAGTPATGSSTTPDPSTVTASWGSADNLFISAAGWDADRLVGTYPTNYTNGIDTVSGGGAGGTGVGTAERQLAASNDDPGTYTLNNTDQWISTTTVVRPPAGTLFQISPTGAITPAGAMIRRALKRLAGTITPSGLVRKTAKKQATGTITPGGALFKRARKALAGTLTSAGSLALRIVKILTVAGTIASSGALFKRTTKQAAGTIGPTGSLAKRARKLLAAAITPTGALALAITGLKTILLTGTLTMAGAMTRQARKLTAGSTSPFGNLQKAARKRLGGQLAPSGTMTARRTLRRLLGGVLGLSGQVLKRVAMRIAGATTPSGTLSLAKALHIALTGTIAATGAIRKTARKLLTGQLLSSGLLALQAGSAFIATAIRRRIRHQGDVTITGGARAGGTITGGTSSGSILDGLEDEQT